MYFSAFNNFSNDLAPPLPNQHTYIIEHCASHILATAAIESLRAVLVEKRLIAVLSDEIKFTGQVPTKFFAQLDQYLSDHEQGLIKTAQNIIDRPSDCDLLNNLTSPLNVPDF